MSGTAGKAISGALTSTLGKTLGGAIGSVIPGLGTMLGKMMAESGAATRIATTLIAAFGERRVHWAMMIVALIVGIPVFFQVGFVLLVPLVFTIARRTGLSLIKIGIPLVAIHDQTFLMGPGFAVGVNGLLLCYLFYRSGLVPRQIAMFGLIGGPLIFASSIAILFGAYEQTGGVGFLFAIPEIVFELGITVYTIWKGFSPSPILDEARYGPVGERSLSPAGAAT